MFSRHLLVVVDPVKQKEQEELARRTSRRGRSRLSSGYKGSQDLVLIKDRLALLFSPTKMRTLAQKDSDCDEGKSVGPTMLQWTEGFQARGKAEISEHCRNAFTAACHLLLESITFPVYYTEEENQELYDGMFENTKGTVLNTIKVTVYGIIINLFFYKVFSFLGYEEGILPEWLRSFMTLCCISKDYQVH